MYNHRTRSQRPLALSFLKFFVPCSAPLSSNNLKSILDDQKYDFVYMFAFEFVPYKVQIWHLMNPTLTYGTVK